MATAAYPPPSQRQPLGSDSLVVVLRRGRAEHGEGAPDAAGRPRAPATTLQIDVVLVARGLGRGVLDVVHRAGVPSSATAPRVLAASVSRTWCVTISSAAGGGGGDDASSSSGHSDAKIGTIGINLGTVGTGPFATSIGRSTENSSQDGRTGPNKLSRHRVARCAAPQPTRWPLPAPFGAPSAPIAAQSAHQPFLFGIAPPFSRR